MSDKPNSQPPAIQSKFLDSRADPLRQRDVATKAFEKVNDERREGTKTTEKAAAGPQTTQPPRLHAPRIERDLRMKGPLAQGPDREAFDARQQMADRYARQQIEKAKAHAIQQDKIKDDKAKDVDDGR